MENFVSFFENLGNGEKFLWIVICMGVFWILEGVYPLFQFDYKKWRHARVNLVLLIVAKPNNTLIIMVEVNNTRFTLA